jgi:Rod binding domain-containing protein
MNIDTNSTSLVPSMPMDLLSSASTGLNGASQPEKLKAACKAIEGLFASQMLKEIGEGVGDPKDPTSAQYGDFVQQALAQQVTAGGGFGLAKMLENSLSPNQVHLPAHVTAAYIKASHHVNGTH